MVPLDHGTLLCSTLKVRYVPLIALKEWPMSRFIEGETRSQSMLFPERLDDWIGEDKPSASD